MHGTRAGNVKHASIYFSVVVAGRDKRDDHLVKLKTLGEMRRGDDHAAFEGRAVGRQYMYSG